MKFLLGCTGSIAVLNVPSLIADLRFTHHADVQVLMTAGAQKFITAFSFEMLTAKPVVTDIFSGYATDHIRLVRSHPVFLIAPATANTLSKVACGIADNIVTLCASVCLGGGTKLVMAPSMNPSMWKNPAIEENVAKLRSRGVEIVPPGQGIAIAEEGEAATAMAQSDVIIETLLSLSR